MATAVDVVKLCRALGLIDGVKGVDIRVRHHLPKEALDRLKEMRAVTYYLQQSQKYF